ncbi:hypothetical protein ACGF0J_13830 [Nonomuraea sp. NPDC047897]|uniref:hypothetical protein n=1 Tax=Nonomuraea sp. NPDC047897 TaxID=3364346 RepID=UPI003724BF14
MPKIMHVWDAELGYSRAAIEARPDGGQVEIDPGTPGAEPMWGLWMTNPVGAVGVMVMPHSIFEWRSAAYGIDPDDIDTLLDVALHEMGIPSPSDIPTIPDPAHAAILDATRDLPTCWTPGVSDEERLAAHLERIRLVKQHRFVIQPAALADRQGALEFVGSPRAAPTDPLEPIKAQVRIDPVRVAAKRLSLDWARETSARTPEPHFGLKPPLTFLSAAETGGGVE